MRVHVLQHVPFEGLGSIADWLARHEATVSWTRFFAPAPVLPPLAEVDLVIALGGPMSVNDEAALPWLAAEKAFVAEAVRAGKAVLGICLGAQLIASALGARVYPGAEKEIGWFPLEAPLAGPGRFAFPATTPVFHWHGETFELPPGARLLASSAACVNQAFQLGRRVIGLQCHLETTPASLAAILEHCADELREGRFIQTPAQMQAGIAAHGVALNALMAQVLDHLVAD